MSTSINYERVHALRLTDLTWAEVARQVGYPNPDTLRKLYHKWTRRREQGGEDAEPHIREKSITREELKRLRSVEDVLAFYGVDPDEWDIKQFWVTGNSWDQSPDFTCHQYKIKIHLVRSAESLWGTLEEELEAALEEMRRHSPAYNPVPRPRLFGPDDEACLFELSLNDAHLGMRSWAPETGFNYDLEIGESDYVRTGKHLLGFARIYNTARILVVIGHDFAHVNQYTEKALTTRRGTQQDADGRLAKIQTVMRRAAVAVIDQARLIAPTDVLLVPGNHDPDQVYQLGEVLNAWYRLDPEVEVIYNPMKRKFYGFGRNTWMMTHGEEYERKRDNLAMIMATECPADLWVASEGGHREVQTGHNHRRLQGGYYPTAEVEEVRAIVTRSLPGLTPTDAWHFESGYLHERAGAALAYRKSGGLVGYHEFSP